MRNQQELQAFRVRQFAGLHPGLLAAGAAAGGPQDQAFPADTERVVLHFDVDCFYAQTEELRDPSLRERPMAVSQKYLVVTANYPARQHGVTKLMGIQARTLLALNCLCL